MPVWVAEVEFAHSPDLIGGRMSHGHAVPQRQGVSRIDLGGRAQPPAHPDPAGFVVPHESGHWTAAGTLCALAEKDLDLTATHGTEGWRIAPLKPLCPTELFEPREALGKAGNI